MRLSSVLLQNRQENQVEVLMAYRTTKKKQKQEKKAIIGQNTAQVVTKWEKVGKNYEKIELSQGPESNEF